MADYNSRRFRGLFGGDAEVPDIHHSAAEGYSVAAAHYEKGRPQYPPEVDTWLRGDLALRKGKTALDLGSGTGKFLPHLRHTEATVIAVEPVAAMLVQLLDGHPESKRSKALPRIFRLLTPPSMPSSARSPFTGSPVQRLSTKSVGS